MAYTRKEYTPEESDKKKRKSNHPAVRQMKNKEKRKRQKQKPAILQGQRANTANITITGQLLP